MNGAIMSGMLMPENKEIAELIDKVYLAYSGLPLSYRLTVVAVIIAYILKKQLGSQVRG